MLKQTSIKLLFALIIFSGLYYRYIKFKPVIGIVSSPELDTTGKSFIKTIYSDFVFSGGGRVVPIPWNAPRDQIVDLLG